MNVKPGSTQKGPSFSTKADAHSTAGGACLSQHHGTPEQSSSVSIDMSPALIKGVGEHLPNARVTFDKFHVVAHASKEFDTVRRQQQKVDPELKGTRWTELCR